jgi:hypothetical protein
MIKRLTLLVVMLLVSIPVMVSLPNQVFAETVDTAWVRRYDGPINLDDYANAIAVDGSGNVYVTGYSKGSGTDWDYATVKYFPNRDTAWVRRYNGPGNSYDIASAIAVDDSGYVYVTGYSEGNGTSNDYATIKYTPAGDTVWVRRYNGPDSSYDYPTAIAVDGSKNVYVCGYSNDNETSDDYTVIKYYPNGDTAWVRRYNGLYNSGDDAKAMVLDHLDNVYVTGTSTTGDDNTGYATIKYNFGGDSLWASIYEGPGNGEDGARAIAIDDSNNVYVTGVSDGGSGTYDDCATIKYYPSGETAWVIRYNSPANESDAALAIAVDDSGNVYVTGQSYGGSGTSIDYCTIKYVKKSSEVKDETRNKERPTEFALSQNYPNPFNQGTKIEFTLSKSGFVTLQIYDLLGRKVRTLVSENLSSGYKSVFWDGKNDDGKDVASGVYFYQLRVGDFSEPKKMLLLK